jgi:hypothetical protein
MLSWRSFSVMCHDVRTGTIVSSPDSSLSNSSLMAAATCDAGKSEGLIAMEAGVDGDNEVGGAEAEGSVGVATEKEVGAGADGDDDGCDALVDVPTVAFAATFLLTFFFPPPRFGFSACAASSLRFLRVRTPSSSSSESMSDSSDSESEVPPSESESESSSSAFSPSIVYWAPDKSLAMWSAEARHSSGAGIKPSLAFGERRAR